MLSRKLPRDISKRHFQNREDAITLSRRTWLRLLHDHAACTQLLAATVSHTVSSKSCAAIARDTDNGGIDLAASGEERTTTEPGPTLEEH